MEKRCWWKSHEQSGGVESTLAHEGATNWKGKNRILQLASASKPQHREVYFQTDKFSLLIIQKSGFPDNW